MSTDDRPIPDIRFSELFDGALAPFQVQEAVHAETTPHRRYLTDGNYFLCVRRGDDGTVAGMTRYGGNLPGKILRVIRDLFKVEIVYEQEPEYWGFATQREWDAAMERVAAEGREEFYENVMHYVRGEAHNLKPDTNGLTWASTAKALIADDPNLALRVP